jgi:DNA-binding CsgD family transcriptional regulator
MTAGHSRNAVPASVALMITPLERAALQLLASGHGRREIATYLGLAEHDATMQLIRLFAKMGVGSDRDAIAAAARRGLLQAYTSTDAVKPQRSARSTWPQMHERPEPTFLPHSADAQRQPRSQGPVIA